MRASHALFRIAAVAAVALFWLAADAKPLVVGIAETCSQADHGRSISVPKNYADAVSRGGHLPLVISRFGSDAQMDAILSRVDVLLLAGGEDVAPARYGDTNHPKLGKVNLERDAFELRILELARKRRLPIVGICRGCQIMNVFFGGTLWQDLPSEFPAENVQHRDVTHPISILPDSRLAQAIGATNATVNSHHHQAVKKVAKGFRIVATAPDGVPEAIESADYPAIGVQFHPEKLVCENGHALFLRFFEHLMLAAREHVGRPE